MILVGFGGVQAEVLRDVRPIVPGLSRDGAVAELLKLRSAAMLTGWRDSPALDLKPVVVYPCAQGCVALDALILVDDAVKTREEMA